MSVVVAGTSSSARYRVWDPTARQVREPDTTYLLDPAAEALLDPWEGGMMAADEVTGGAPPWRGGVACEVVPGKYRDGLRAVGSGYVIHPSTGLIAADQWTYEMFVASTVAWASLSNAYALQIWNDYGQILSIILSGSTARAGYMHNQDTAGIVNKAALASGQSHAADAFVSVAVTLLAGTMRLYVNGAQAATATDCTSPRSGWSDNWNAPYGGMAISVNAALTVSDFRISRLARVPGEVPTP